MKARGLIYGVAFLLELLLFALGFAHPVAFLLATATVLELVVAMLHGKQTNT